MRAIPASAEEKAAEEGHQEHAQGHHRSCRNHAAIATVIASLRNCTLTGTTSHAKLECLAQLVRQACTSLRRVHAEQSLAGNFSLIGLLAGKLATLYVDKWDEFVTVYGGEVSWTLFEAWLVKANATATAVRTRELGTALSYPPPKGGLGSHGIIIAAGARRQDDENKATPREGTARPRGLVAGRPRDLQGRIRGGGGESKRKSEAMPSLQGGRKARASSLLREKLPRMGHPGHEDLAKLHAHHLPSLRALGTVWQGRGNVLHEGMHQVLSQPPPAGQLLQNGPEVQGPGI